MVPVEFPDKGHTTVMMPTPPLAFSRYACRTYKPTRGIGDNTEEILKEMGYSKEEIKALTEANVSVSVALPLSVQTEKDSRSLFGGCGIFVYLSG